MKAKIIVITFALFQTFSGNLNAQEPSNIIITTPTNTTCRAAVEVCDDLTQNFDFTSDGDCTQDLWYRLKVTETTLLNIRFFIHYSHPTTVFQQTPLRVYGPFDTNDDINCHNNTLPQALMNTFQLLPGISNKLIYVVEGKYYYFRMTTQKCIGTFGIQFPNPSASIILDCLTREPIEDDPVITPSTNTNCANAMKICDNFSTNYSFRSSLQGNCNTNTLFYYFRAATTQTLNTEITYTGNTGTANLTIYGPYTTPGITMCNAVLNNQLTAPPIPLNQGINPFQGTVEGGKYYVLKLTTSSCEGTFGINFIEPIASRALDCSPPDLCEECVTSFSPTPGKYIVSAWVKEVHRNQNDTEINMSNYSSSGIKIGFNDQPSPIETFYPTGNVIDGWQRIESEIEILPNFTSMQIELFTTLDNDVFFDDIRFFPFNGSMMSYVYDPESLRLMAELDERNYATLYEYDEEGKLIRVKKETEKGVMTIQENKDNIKK